MAALLKADPAGMIYWNALLFPLAVLLVVAGFRQPWSWRGWAALGGIIVVFSVMRNLPFYLLY